jgi:Tol biopolymer transport system component
MVLFGITAFIWLIVQQAAAQTVVHYTPLSLATVGDTEDSNLGLAAGQNQLLSIPFETGHTITTQFVDRPTQPQIVSLSPNLAQPRDVVFLIQAGWGATEFVNQQIGVIALQTTVGTFTYPLVLGQNIRDWSIDSPIAVRTVTSSDVQQAWTGQTDQGQNGRIDMLTVSLPPAFQDSTLTGIEIRDTSLTTTGEQNPGLHVLAVTVSTEEPQGALPSGRVVFMSDRDDEDQDIYIVNTDGTGLARLTNNLRGDILPRLSPDGTKVAFQSYRNGNWDVCVVDVAGVPETNLRCLTEASAAFDGQPAWSPDGSQLAFTSNRGANGWFRVYIMNADGSNVREVTTGAGPAWSPDGQYLVHQDWNVDNNDIYTIRTDGQERTRLTTSSAEDSKPVWSPDGARIAFISNRNGNEDIFTINVDGSGLNQRTTSPFRDNDPAWLPDSARLIFGSNRAEEFDLYVLRVSGAPDIQLFEPGRTIHRTEAQPDWGTALPPIGPTPVPTAPPTRTPPIGPPTPIVPVDDLSGCIAFASNRQGGNNDIYVAAADGTSGNRQLTTDSADDVNPDLTQDCSQVVFESSRSGDREIYVMDVTGSPETNIRRLTNSPGFDGQPVWSPDGSQIAFASLRTNYYAVFIMNADGSNLRQVSSGAAPDWSPDGSQLVFRDWNVDNNDIFVIDVDAQNQNERTALTTNPALDTDPAWSPDGSRIVFATKRDGNLEIYVMNADGSNKTRRTNTIDLDTDPTWSPDGQQIIFESARESFFDLYIIDAFGTLNEISLLAINRQNAQEIDPMWSGGSPPPPGPVSTPTPLPANETPTIGLEIATNAIEPDEAFEFSVVTSGIPNAAGIEFALAYDTSAVECIIGFPGDDQPFPFFNLDRSVCNAAPGRYEWVSTVTNNAGIPAGELARIRFRSQDVETDSTIRIVPNSVQVVDANGAPIDVDIDTASFTISISAAAIEGVASCQASDPNNPRQTRIFGSSFNGTGTSLFTLAQSGAPYALPASTSGNPWSVIAACNCHLNARVLNVTSPSTGNNVTLRAGDIVGAQTDRDDGEINVRDAIALAARLGGTPGNLPCADLNQDGEVDVADLAILRGNFGLREFTPFDGQPPALADATLEQDAATVSCRVESATEDDPAVLVLEVTGVEDLYGYSVNLATDPALVQPARTGWDTSRSLLQPDEGGPSVLEMQNATTGDSLDVSVIRQNSAQPVSGSGELARIALRSGTDAGTHTFSVEDIILADRNANFIPHQMGDMSGCTFVSDGASTATDGTVYLPLLQHP